MEYESDALLRQQKYILMLTYQLPIHAINSATAKGLKALTKYKELQILRKQILDSYMMRTQ